MLDSFSESKYGIAKKRVSIDSEYKPKERKSKLQSNHEYKNERSTQRFGSQHSNSFTLSLRRDHANKLEKTDNLHPLREEVEQLRMENESLREEIRNFRNSELHLEQQINKFKREIERQEENKQKYIDEIEKQQEKISKYSSKIKELFESLIAEKKKNSGFDQSNLKKVSFFTDKGYLDSYLDIKKFEEEGEKEYYRTNNSTNEPSIKELSKTANLHKNTFGGSFNNVDNSPASFLRGNETFRTRY